MVRLIFVELQKTFLKKRTYLGFLIVLIIVPLIEVAMKLEGGRFVTNAFRSVARDFVLVGNLFNGWLVSYQIMNSLWVHIPLLVSFVAGDQLAGEATSGTYRLILTRPVSRTRIFLAKYFTVVLYTVVFVLFLAVLSIGLAVLLLGRGDLLLFARGGQITILPEGEVLWRFALAYLFACCSMITVSSIAFFFSSFVENAIGPIVATMGVLITFMVLTALPVEVLESVRTHFFTYYLDIWQRPFEDPISWERIATALLYFAGYSIVAVAGAWAVFLRKDILS
ncbi:MAG: ABC transporter permease [Bacteroidetes bacterium]|jgi:ABC-2 type transport system permease protein|nr:ABC transporter permease [Bacteroidota bacterium]